jgi:hypothetical protein
MKPSLPASAVNSPEFFILSGVAQKDPSLLDSYFAGRK